MIKLWNEFDLHTPTSYPPPDTLIWLYCEQRGNMGECLPRIGYYDSEDMMFYVWESGIGMTKVSHWMKINVPSLPPLTDQACDEFYIA